MKRSIETEVAKERNKEKNNNTQAEDKTPLKKGANEFRYCSGCGEEMPVQFKIIGKVKSCTCLICGQTIK